MATRAEAAAARHRCGAKTRSGEPCRQLGLNPNGLCKMHGGHNRGGVLSPTFKTGLSSRYIPERLQARYDAVMADQEILNLRGDIALIEARIGDLLTRVDVGEAGKLWRRLAEAWEKFLQAEKVGVWSEQVRAQLVVGDIIKAGSTDAFAWQEVAELVEQKRKLVESERKRLIEMNQTITTEQAMTFVAAVAQSVNRHVQDPEARRAVAADIARLTGRPVQ